MRLATWAQVAARAVALLLSAIGMHTSAARTPLLSIASVSTLIGLATSVAVLVGLFRYGDAPPSLGVTEPARRALAAHVGTLSTTVPGLLMSSAGLHRWGNHSALGAIATLQQVASFGLTVAYLELLRRALSATVQALGGSWPAWTARLVPAYVAWRVFATISLVGVGRFSYGMPIVAWSLASLAIDAAFVLAFTRLMRLAEDALARQETTESALAG